jgi:hypothetical protein
MAEHHKQEPMSDDHAVTSVTILLLHLTWVFLGPIVLFVILYGVVKEGASWITPLDFLYFAIVGLILLARWLDQKSGQSTNSEGEPSTWEDFRHYIRMLPVYALAAWIVSKGVGHFF